MSVQENFADCTADARLVYRILELLPQPVAFLPFGSEVSFAAANANRGWPESHAKRALDIVIAVPALLLVSPLLFALAVLIRLDSEGPALFRQTRMGRDGASFDIFKLRTMTVQENGTDIVQASRGDARVTRLGRWLRAYSLDELPQLINVVKGEMSLVGPRPHALAHDRRYGLLLADYPRRHSVKPGLTGLAQVNGLRGATPTLEAMARRVELDLQYVNRAGFALDAEILFRTPFEMLRRRNAY